MPVGRAFVAIVPPDDVLDAVAGVADVLREHIASARWTRREQWHLTLQFLGNRVDLDAAATALRDVHVDAAEVALGEVGAFADARRSRVVWLGVRAGAGWLGDVADAVAAALRPTGFVPERRPFHAHLTLARLAPPADVRAALSSVDAVAVGAPWTGRELVLFHRVTGRDGARYTPVTTVRCSMPGDA